MMKIHKIKYLGVFPQSVTSTWINLLTQANPYIGQKLTFPIGFPIWTNVEFRNNVANDVSLTDFSFTEMPSIDGFVLILSTL